MLVLFKSEIKGAFPLPFEQWMELVVKHQETLINYKQQGKIVTGGPSLSSKAGYFIFDVDSLEELQGLVAQLPMFPFMEVELIPLTTLEYAIKGAKQQLASLREVKK